MGILYPIIMYAQSSRTVLSLTLNVRCNVEIVVGNDRGGYYYAGFLLQSNPSISITSGPGPSMLIEGLCI